MSDIGSIILDAFASVIEPNGAIYAAGPLATGLDYYAALRDGALVATVDVRPQNEQKLRAFVSALRKQSKAPVIDPSVIRPPDWSDAAIGELYLLIISRFACEAWFIDGWEFSRGASKEFLHCIREGIVCKDQRGGLMARDAGLDRLTNAAQLLSDWGQDNSRFILRINELRTIHA